VACTTPEPSEPGHPDGESRGDTSYEVFTDSIVDTGVVSDALFLPPRDDTGKDTGEPAVEDIEPVVEDIEPVADTDMGKDADTDAGTDTSTDTGEPVAEDIEVVWAKTGVGETVTVPESTFLPDVFTMEQGGVRGTVQISTLGETKTLFVQHPFRIELQSNSRLRAWNTKSSKNFGVESNYVVTPGEVIHFDFSTHYSTDGRNRPIWRLSVEGDNPKQEELVTWADEARLTTMPRLGNLGAATKVSCAECTFDIEIYRYTESYRDGVILDFDPLVQGVDSWPHNDIGPSAKPTTQYVRADVSGSPACIQFETFASDPTTSTGGKRNEVAEAYQRPYQSTFYYGMRFRIDPAWVDDGSTDNFYILSQFWTGGSPDAAIVYRNDTLRIGVFVDAATLPDDPSNASHEETVLKGGWVNVVLKYRKSETDGLLNAWILLEGIDSGYRSVIDYAGKLSDEEDEQSGIWIKAGTYRRANGTGPTVVQIDRNKVGATFDAADPRRE